MSATKRKAGPDTGALGYKIETAEACGGVVTLSAAEAKLLKEAVLQHGALADALSELFKLVEDGVLVRDIANDRESGFLVKAMNVVTALKKADHALRAAGRLP